MESKSLNEIAQRIKQRREALGLSLKHVADLTGISKSTLQRYETGGIKNIPIQRLDGLAKALNTTPEWIMGTSENGWYSCMLDIYRELAPGDLPSPERAAVMLYKEQQGLPFSDLAHYEAFLTSDEEFLVVLLRQFTDEGKKKIREYMADLMESPKYFIQDKD